MWTSQEDFHLDTTSKKTFVKITYPCQRPKTPPLSHYFLLVKVNLSMRHLELVPAFFTPVLADHLY